MNISYKSINNEKDEQFIALFALGIINAVKCNLIDFDDAWSWLVNIHTLDFIELNDFDDALIDAIHLGTELENVKRIIPYAFENSCNEIIDKLNQVISKKSECKSELDCLISFS